VTVIFISVNPVVYNATTPQIVHQYLMCKMSVTDSIQGIVNNFSSYLLKICSWSYHEQQ